MSAVQKRLIIISAGALGREFRDLAEGFQLLHGERCPWRFAGFLDNREDILKGTNAAGAVILGDPLDYQPQDNDLFICAIGDPKVRRQYSDKVRAQGGRFASLIDSSSCIANSAQIGDGSLIGPFCAISCDLDIGADTVITAHVTIGHDVTIGRSCHISAHAFIGGGAVLGDEVTIHPHAVILPRVKIGNKCTVGAGSVVIDHVAEAKTVFGVPARALAI